MAIYELKLEREETGRTTRGGLPFTITNRSSRVTINKTIIVNAPSGSAARNRKPFGWKIKSVRLIAR